MSCSAIFLLLAILIVQNECGLHTRILFRNEDAEKFSVLFNKLDEANENVRMKRSRFVNSASVDSFSGDVDKTTTQNTETTKSPLKSKGIKPTSAMKTKRDLNNNHPNKDEPNTADNKISLIRKKRHETGMPHSHSLEGSDVFENEEVPEGQHGSYKKVNTTNQKSLLRNKRHFTGKTHTHSGEDDHNDFEIEDEPMSPSNTSVKKNETYPVTTPVPKTTTPKFIQLNKKHFFGVSKSTILTRNKRHETGMPHTHSHEEEPDFFENEEVSEGQHGSYKKVDTANQKSLLRNKRHFTGKPHTHSGEDDHNDFEIEDEPMSPSNTSLKKNETYLVTTPVPKTTTPKFIQLNKKLFFGDSKSTILTRNKRHETGMPHSHSHEGPDVFENEEVSEGQHGSYKKVDTTNQKSLLRNKRHFTGKPHTHSSEDDHNDFEIEDEPMSPSNTSVKKNETYPITTPVPKTTTPKFNQLNKKHFFGDSKSTILTRNKRHETGMPHTHSHEEEPDVFENEEVPEGENRSSQNSRKNNSTNVTSSNYVIEILFDIYKKINSTNTKSLLRNKRHNTGKPHTHSDEDDHNDFEIEDEPMSPSNSSVKKNETYPVTTPVPKTTTPKLINLNKKHFFGNSKSTFLKKEKPTTEEPDLFVIEDETTVQVVSTTPKQNKNILKFMTTTSKPKTSTTTNPNPTISMLKTTKKAGIKSIFKVRRRRANANANSNSNKANGQGAEKNKKNKAETETTTTAQPATAILADLSYYDGNTVIYYVPYPADTVSYPTETSNSEVSNGKKGKGKGRGKGKKKQNANGEEVPVFNNEYDQNYYDAAEYETTFNSDGTIKFNNHW